MYEKSVSQLDESQIVDLRSDTVTKPTPEMRKAMFEAEVGDDVYAEDPTVNRLEQRAAEIFAREAAIFVPSGTMGNQIAIKVHTRPGQEIICEERGHIFNFEMAMLAWFSGCLPKSIAAEGGTVYPQEVADEICERAHELGLPVHLDGARVFNAAVALGKPVAEVTKNF